MKLKIIAVFIVLLLIVFSIGYAFGITREEIKDFEVIADSSISYGKAPLFVSFTSTIPHLEKEIVKITWDFNDGGTSKERNTSHTFDREGTFNVTVTVWNDEGEKTCDSILIIVYNYYHPIASAISDKNYGKTPLTVQFNAEGFDIESEKFQYLWDFDDGTTSDKKNVSHTFLKKGIYHVRLTVIDEDGLKDTDIIQINAVENIPPIARATANTQEGSAPLTVDFNGYGEDKDGSKLTYHWYFENNMFGKAIESTERNPTHKFKFPGTYIVKLTVSDEDGANDTDILKIIVNEGKLSKIINSILDIQFIKELQKNLAKNLSFIFLVKWLSRRVGKKFDL